MAHINLLPWREVKRKEQQREFTSILACTAILTGILGIYVHIHINGNIEYQERRNQFLESEIKILDDQIKDIARLESTKKALLDRMQVIDSLQAKRPGIVHLFDELVRTLPEGTYLTAVRQNDDDLTITGKAESNARVSAYMREIDESSWLADARLDVIETTDDQMTRISDFTLQARQAAPDTAQTQVGDEGQDLQQ